MQHFSSLDIAGIRVFVALIVLGCFSMYLEHRWNKQRFRKNVRYRPVREIGFKQCQPQEKRG